MLGERGFWLRHAASTAPGATARTARRAASMRGLTAAGSTGSRHDVEEVLIRGFIGNVLQVLHPVERLLEDVVRRSDEDAPRRVSLESLIRELEAEHDTDVGR